MCGGILAGLFGWVLAENVYLWPHPYPVMVEVDGV